MIMTIEPKQASKGNEIHLVMTSFSGLVDDVNDTSPILLMMVGGIELHDDLIVPILMKLHQASKPHIAQIIHHISEFLHLESHGGNTQ